MALTADRYGYFQETNGTDRPFIGKNYNDWAMYFSTDGMMTKGETLTTQLQCSASSGTMNTSVAAGAFQNLGVLGVFSAGTLTHDTADATNPRIDVIYCEQDYSSGVRACTIDIAKGTPAASPVAPSLTTGTTQNQVKLYEVLIPAAETDSDNFTYTDYRELAVSNQNNSGVFTTDLQAPNLTIEDSGYIYLNTAKTAYIRYVSNALYLKLPSCDEVQIPTISVGTSSTAPTPTTNFPINHMYLERDS